VRDEILAKIQELREKVGYSLSAFVLNKYAGGAEPDKVGHAKLTMMFEKLTDLGNGIDRLRRAAAIVGDGRYAIICRELNFASESIDDIPDRDALKLLLERVEAEGGAKNGNHMYGAAAIAIADARGRLLQAARKMADRTGKRLADVISEASDGRLTLDGLKNLMDSDIPLVSAATARMG
jgi:hypothetical protein